MMEGSKPMADTPTAQDAREHVALDVQEPRVDRAWERVDAHRRLVGGTPPEEERGSGWVPRLS